MNLGELARARAQALQPKPKVSAGAVFAGVTAYWLLIIPLTIWWCGTIGIGRGLERGLGVYLMMASSGYLAISFRMWWSRLVLRRPMHWTQRPSPIIVACAWVGAAIFVSTLGLGSGFAPFGLRLRIDTGTLGALIAMVVFYGLLIGVPAGLTLLWVNRRRSSSGLQIHVAQTRAESRQQRRYAERVDAKAAAAAEWRLHLGTATGYCRSRNDEHGCYAGDQVSLSLIDAAKGVLISGQMGAGKTSLMRRIARQVAAMLGTALVVMSAKSDDTQTIASYFPDPLIIGPGHGPFALFRGLTPEAIGHVFGSLAGDPRTKFWGAAVANLVTAWMQICLGLAGSTIVIPEQRETERTPYTPERVLEIGYSPQSLSDLIYAPDHVMAAVLSEAARRLPTLSRDVQQLSAGLAYFSGEFQATLGTARGETLGSVRASVSPYLRALCSPGFSEAFASGDLDLSAAIDAGRAIIVNVDMGSSPQGFAVASSLILAHLRQIALARTSRDPALNNPCVVLADEFGTYASTDHLGLFETARQARIVCLASIIGLSNLEARLGHAAAYSIPSAVGSMITFATGDQATRKYVSDRIGSVRSLEISQGSSTSPHSQTPFVRQSSYSSSERFVTEPVVEDAAWNNLGVRTDAGYATAVAILAQGGGVQHDVIMVPAE